MNNPQSDLDVSSMLLKEFSNQRLAFMSGAEVSKVSETTEYEASAVYGLEDASQGNYVFLIDFRQLKMILEKKEDDPDGSYNFFSFNTETRILTKNNQPIQNHAVFMKIIKDFNARNSKTEKLAIKIKKH